VVCDIGTESTGDAGPGIEHGTYTWNAETAAFTVASIIRDTNGEAGISHDAPLTAEVDGDTMTMTFAGDAVTLKRLK